MGSPTPLAGTLLTLGTFGAWRPGIPATPTLEVTDKADGTGATAEVSGSDTGSTNTIWVSEHGSGTWTASAARTGDGTANLALASGRYWAFVESEIDDYSARSAPVTFVVTGADSVFTPEEAVFTLLTDDAEVAALVTRRIYPQYAPQGCEWPLVVYARIDSDHHRHMAAASGLNAARIQVDSYAASYAGAKNLGDKVRLALDGYTGTVLGADGSLKISRILLVSDNDAVIGPTAGRGKGWFTVSHDYTVWHQETVPSFPT